MLKKNNIILTGIPRSGTSFVCSLLNQLEDVLALVEPIDMEGFLACRDSAERKLFLTNYFQSARHTLITTKKILGLDLESETNTFSNAVSGARQNTIKGVKEQYINKPLTEQFVFVVKHPNAFSALLKELCLDWNCFAIIRNPVAVIASWNTLSHPLSKGHAPMAEAFDHSLRSMLGSIGTSLERQIYLMNWYFEQYSKYLSCDKIIRYESVIYTAGAALSVIVPGLDHQYDQSVSMNNSRLYDSVLMKDIALRLIDVGGAWTGFYSKEDVLGLVAGQIA